MFIAKRFALHVNAVILTAKLVLLSSQKLSPRFFHVTSPHLTYLKWVI